MPDHLPNRIESVLGVRQRTLSDEQPCSSEYERSVRSARSADLSAFRPHPHQAIKAEGARVLRLLGHLVEEIEVLGLDEIFGFPTRPSPAYGRLVGLTPANRAAFDAFLGGFLDQLTDAGQIAAQRSQDAPRSWQRREWAALNAELASLPVRRAVARGQGDVRLPRVESALHKIRTSLTSNDDRDHCYAGALAAVLGEAVCTSQALRPGGSGVVRRTSSPSPARVKKSAGVEISPGFWVDEADVEWVDGSPKLKKGAAARPRYHDVREGR